MHKKFKKQLIWFFSLVFIALISIQLSPVHYFLLNNSLIDSAVSKVDKYNSLKASVYNRFPGFAYSYIGVSIAGSEKDKEKIANKINLYLYNNVFQPVNYEPVDAAAISQLVRGIGWCDQMSHIFIRLADTHNLPGHIENLFNNSGVSPHTIATLFLDDEWLPIDPTYGSSFINDKNKFISKNEVCKNLGENFEPFPGYTNLFCNDTYVFMKNEAAGEYNSIIFDAIQNQQEIPISTVSDPWRLIFKLPDFIGADLFLRLYLMILKSDLNNYEFLYQSARINHILGKYEESIKLYEKVIKQHPSTIHALESYFWIGLARFHNKQYVQAYNHLENFINNETEIHNLMQADGWLPYAKIYAGRSLIELQRTKEAILLFNSVKDDLSSGSANTHALKELFKIKKLNM